MLIEGDSASSGQSDVILYELNEVPWSIVDLYLKFRPRSNLSALIASGQSLTTVDDDAEHLSPWRTWPTLHTSMYTSEHNSFDLGQDPATFRGDTIWDLSERAGLSVGLFGALQSWPPRMFAHGHFYVPDTFSYDEATYPRSLQRFQQFNLAMTKENNFSSDTPLNGRMLLASGLDLARLGLTTRSSCTIIAHLARERIDHRYKAFRSSVQVLPSFDLYWRLHKQYRPRLSIFFTNHVAGMMHRFWGDAVPGYVESHKYKPDKVFGKFILNAMDLVDRQLGHIRGFMATHPRTMLVIAASMGQGPVNSRYQEQDLFVLEDPDRLISGLGLRPAEPGMAMYPRLSLIFGDSEATEEAVEPLSSVKGDASGPMFKHFTINGRTLSFAIDNSGKGSGLATQLTFTRTGGTNVSLASPSELGITVRPRLGGDNTAYHVPEGMLLAIGNRLEPDDSRKRVSVLDVTPSLLGNVLGVSPGPMMRGAPTLFGSVATVRTRPLAPLP